MARGQKYSALEDREDEEELELLPLNDPSTTAGAADIEIQVIIIIKNLVLWSSGNGGG